MKAEEILEKHSDVKVSEIVKSNGVQIGAISFSVNNKPLITIDQALMAMSEYAQQYKEALIKICEEKDKAKNTQDLFNVLQEIEKARLLLTQSL